MEEENLKTDDKNLKDTIVQHAYNETLNLNIVDIDKENVDEIKKHLIGIINWFSKNKINPYDMRFFIKNFSRVFMLSNMASLTNDDEYVKVGNKQVNIRNVNCVKIKDKTFDVSPNCIMIICRKIVNSIIDKDFTGIADIMNMRYCIFIVDDNYNFTGKIITGYYIEPEDYNLSVSFSETNFYSLVEMIVVNGSNLLVKNNRILEAEMKRVHKPYTIECDIKNVPINGDTIDSIIKSSGDSLKKFYE